MVARNVQVPMYQAKIPMRGGGGMRGRIDLTERPEPNPIVQALLQMVQQKRQTEQDELGRQMTEARIGQMQQPKQPTMKIVVGDGKTWLVNQATGEKRDLGIVPPKSKVGGRSTIDIINDMGKVSRAAGAIPEDALEQPIIDAQMGPLRQELMGGLGLEEAEEETEVGKRLFGIPGTETTWNLWPGQQRTEKRKVIRKRKRVESKVKAPTPITEALEEKPTERKVKPIRAKAEKRPPKPKEYPDAKWSEEHQIWTIVKNGRLMGIK